MKKLVKKNENDILTITIEAYGCGDSCTCYCGTGDIAGGEPGGSASPSTNK